MLLLELAKLTPFYASQVIYWHLAYIPTSQPGLWTAFIKCLPVATLAFYLATCAANDNAGIKNLFFGMLFSNAGDFCLVYPEYFLLGILCFAIAHIFFILAFGFKPLRLPILLLIIGPVLVYVLSLLLPNINEEPLKIGFPIYASILGIMAWRGLARCDQGILEFLTGIGTVIFVISDAAIGINMFYTKLDNPQVLIMSTYYLAQFLITLTGVSINLNMKMKDE